VPSNQLGVVVGKERGTKTSSIGNEVLMVTSVESVAATFVARGGGGTQLDNPDGEGF